jgi:hypothetical protein
MFKLTNQEFIRAVEAQARDVPAGLLRQAAEAYLILGEPTEQEAKRVGVLLRATWAWVEQRGPAHNPMIDRQTIEALLAEGQIAAERLAHEVAAIRRKLFRSPGVPFPDYDQAAAWLEREAQRQLAPRDKTRVGALERALVRHVQRLRNLGRPVRVAFTRPVLRYLPSKEPDVRVVPVQPGSKLAKLAEWAQTLARAAGCSDTLMLAHLLSGVPLACGPRLHTAITSIQLPLSRQWLARVDVTVQLPAPQMMTARTWMRLYRSLRQEVPRPHAYQITPKQAALLRLVGARGGVPRTGKVAFWQRCLVEWNARYARRWGRRRTWRGLEMAYQRLQARLRTRDAFPLPIRQAGAPRVSRRSASRKGM